MLGRARADAVGLQVPRGVAFYTDATGQCRMSEVGAAGFPAWAGNLTPYSKGSYVSSSTTAGGVTTTAYYVALQNIPSNTGTPANLPPATSPGTDTAYWHIFVDATKNPIPAATTVVTDAYTLRTLTSPRPACSTTSCRTLTRLPSPRSYRSGCCGQQDDRGYHADGRRLSP